MRYSSYLAAIVSLFLFPLWLFAQEDPAKKITLTWDQLQQKEVPRIKIYVISTATDLEDIPGDDSTRIVRGRRNREFLVRVDHSPAVRETFRGSPYLYAVNYPAALTDRSGETYERVPLRYDLYKDRLEYIKEGRPVTLNPADVPAFVFIDSLTGRPRRFRNGFEPPDDLELHRNSYFEVLYDGPTKLLRHLRKVPFNQVDGSPHNAILNISFACSEQRLKPSAIWPVKRSCDSPSWTTSWRWCAIMSEGNKKQLVIDGSWLPEHTPPANHEPFAKPTSQLLSRRHLP